MFLVLCIFNDCGPEHLKAKMWGENLGKNVQFLKDIGPFKTMWSLGKGRYNDRSGQKKAKINPDGISFINANTKKMGNKTISKYIYNRYNYNLRFGELPILSVYCGNFHYEYYPFEILLLYDDAYC